MSEELRKYKERDKIFEPTPSGVIRFAKGMFDFDRRVAFSKASPHNRAAFKDTFLGRGLRR